jgi:hypothetical protein
MSDTKTTTYTANMSKSLAEEVDKIIANIAPTDTPFISMIGSANCESIKPEWLEDTLGDAAANKQLEGFDAVAAAVVPPAKLENYTQIMAKVFMVSGSLEEAKKHGRKSELAYQTGLRMKELARDLEWNALNSTKAAGEAGVARSMDGLFAFAHADNTYTFGATAAATNHITEPILNDVLQAMWQLGANPDTVLAPPAQKRKISSFTDDGRLTINTNADQKKITMTVRILETDFGTVAIVPERFIAATGSDPFYDSLAIFEKAKLDVLTFRPVKREELAKTGDNTKYMLLAEKSLRCRSTKCVGKITNLTRVKA